jgi:glycosyltransferase involved in cell wall biosynthesis
VRIGLILPGFSAGPDDWCIPALRDFARCLASRDDVRVLALRYPQRAGRYELFGARVTALGGNTRRGIGSAGVWRAALAYLITEHRRERFDVLHAFWATESGAVAALAGRILGIPTVVSVAGGELVALAAIGYGDQLVAFERLKVRLALSLARRVTVGSAYLGRLVQPRLPRSTGVADWAPLGVDLELFRRAKGGEPAGPARLLHVGSLVPVKDQATLLRAAGELARWGYDFRLDLAGSGPRKPYLQTLAHDFGIEQRVTFHGEVAHDALPSLYARAAVFVLTSLHEAQSLVALEAAASGLPVVGPPVGLIPELAPDAAVLVPGDPDALAGALATLLDDPERRRAMGRAGRAQVESSYDLATCVERFRKIYQSLAPARL